VDVVRHQAEARDLRGRDPAEPVEEREVEAAVVVAGEEDLAVVPAMRDVMRNSDVDLPA
jgi:hypothetical protein